MALPQIYQGALEQFLRRPELKNRTDLLLIIPQEDTNPVDSALSSPEARRDALDALAEMNRGLPVFPPEAFNRENLYANYS